MANANPENQTFDDDSDDDDVDDEPTISGGKTPNSANGTTVQQQVDRYGFLGGSQYTHPSEQRKIPAEKLRKRELKWLDMFENWEKWMSKRFKKVKDRCRKGIPPSVRARAWQHLCASKFTMEQNKGKFEEYLQMSGDPKWIDDIQKDLHRQFPQHEMFLSKEGHGQESLFHILKAYSIHNPADGYCQAQAPLAALLLMHMPAEQAFWTLVAICDKYLPGYYSPGLEAVQLDGDVLFGLIKRTSPQIYKLLKKNKVEPTLYMTEWFMCIFTRNLPWSSVLRIWDMFFCEGVKVMFRVGLVMIKLGIGENLSECTSFYDILEKLRRIPHEYLEEDFLVRESLKLNVTERDMEKEHQRQLARRKTAKEKEKATRAAAGRSERT